MIKNLKNKRSGKLLFLNDSGKRKNGNVIWRCICDCGNYHEVEARNFNIIKSCGCFHKEKITKHSRSRIGDNTYYTWMNMKKRCININDKSYHRYGDRGIQVCERWLNSFENFLDDMGERPEGMTIDRIDNNGNYTPDNCKWSTYKEQANNRKNTKLSDEDIIEIRRLLDEGMFQKDIAERFSITQGYISEIKNRKKR